MDADTWRWIWLGVAGACAVGELAVPGTFFVLSFAVGAVVAAVVAFLDASAGLQWALFVGVSAASLVLLVPLGRRLASHEGDEAQEGATRWVGRVGVVIEEIPGGPHATGRVRVERDEWRAETDDHVSIPLGAQIEVLAVRGTRLVVAPSGSNQS
jgi:membrane protein implicated in regulation of membrane protease activity